MTTEPVAYVAGTTIVFKAEHQNTTPPVGATPIVAAPNIPPRKVPLPLGGTASMYTRENLTLLLKCSHGELGRLLARRMMALPIRVDGQILWYVDDVIPAQAQVIRTLERWRKR